LTLFPNHFQIKLYYFTIFINTVFDFPVFCTKKNAYCANLPAHYTIILAASEAIIKQD